MIDTLMLWWEDNATTFVTGSVLWMAVGCAAVRFAQAPIQRQRLAECALAAFFLWLVVAILPTPRFADFTAAAQATPIAVDLPMLATPAPAVEHAPVSSPASGPTAGAWVGAVFLLGALAMALYVLGAWLLLARLLRRTRPAPAALVEKAAGLPLAPPRLRLRISDQTARPFCCGLLRPRVVLPAAFEVRAAFPRARPVLLHEFAHIAQGDLRGRVLFALALPLLFWNPLFWWLRHSTQLCAELVADDLAVRHLDRATYVRELIDLAERSPKAREQRVAALAVLGHETEFFRRMKMLMQRQGRLSTRCSLVHTCARHACAVALVAAASLAWQSPELFAQGKEVPATSDKAAKKDTSSPIRAELRFGYADDKQLGDFVTKLALRGFRIDRLVTGKGESGEDLGTVEITSLVDKKLLEAVQRVASASKVTVYQYRPMRPKAPVAAKPKPDAKEGEKAAPEEPARVYFAFENSDIRKVIDTIAKVSGANLVVAPDVQGTVTLRLKDVPWRDALDAAVQTLGFTVTERPSGILVITTPSAAPKR